MFVQNVALRKFPEISYYIFFI